MTTIDTSDNSAPTITGGAAASTGDNAIIQSFANVTVADADDDLVSLRISYNADNGTLSGAGLSGTAGSYLLSATTPAALSAQLKALTFTPKANQAVVGVNVTTTFSLAAIDSHGASSAVDTTTVVHATSVNDAPVLSGTAAGLAVAAGGTVRPFGSVTLSDPDVAAVVTVSIQLDSASKGVFTPASLLASGFTTTDGGVSYSLSAAAPGAAQAALQALVFQTTPGLNATTTFTLSVNDGSVIVSNGSTTVQSAVPPTTTALTVAFSNDTGVSHSDLITFIAAQNLSGTLSSGLLSGERVEVSLDNGASWTRASADVGATTWQLTGQTLTGAGTLQVRVTNSGGGSTPLSASYRLDVDAPVTTGATVSFSVDTGNGINDLVTRAAAQTVSGTLSASLASGEHVEVSFNNGSSWSTASASAGSSAWTLNGVVLGAGSNILQVRVVDEAGNAGSAVSSQYVLDTTGPSATLHTDVSVVGAGQPAEVIVSFTERPYGLTLASFNAVGGTVANLQATADPLVYTLQYTPNAGIGNVVGSVQLVAGSYTDLAGNSGAAALSSGMAVTLGPTVTITSDAAILNIGQTANVNFTFSSAPIGFTASDVVVSGGTLSGLTNQGGGVYTALFTPGAELTGPASITVTGGSYTDILSLAGASGVSPRIAIDTRAPTLTITSNAGALKIGDTATITFAFSEVPHDFVLGNVAVINGSLSGLAVTANPLVYTALLTPNHGVASGVVTLSVASGAYTDAAGNSGGGVSLTDIRIDTAAPAASVASVRFSLDGGASSTDLITNSAAQTISGTVDRLLDAGDVVEVSIDSGVTWTGATSVGTAWSLDGQTLRGSDTLQVRVTDAAGNHGAVFSAPYHLDTTAASVALTSSLGVLRAGETAYLFFTFSEAPANFTLSALTVTGGTVSGLAATANPLVYTALFTPTPGQSGQQASIAVNAGGYSDTAGNSGQASAALAITLITSVPTLDIASDATALALGETALITFTFSSAPVAFTAAHISVNNGVLTGLVATANPLVYTAQFTPTVGVSQASAGVTVAAGAYVDTFGNSGSGATLLPLAIDTLAPSVTITSSSPALKAGETAQITFTFSEAPQGFTAADVNTTAGTLSGLAPSANPLVYTALFTPSAGIQNTSASITVAAGAFTDAAGNASLAALTPPLALDTRAPTAMANTVLFLVDGGISATDLVTNVAAQTISGTVDRLLGAGEYIEVSLDNGVSWNGATSNGMSWSLAGTALSASNVLQVRVTDAAGNHGPVFARDYVLDTAMPTVTISTSLAGLKAGDTAVITFTFSEAPIGFTEADLVVSGGSFSGLAVTANPLVYTGLFTPGIGVNGGNGTVSITAASYIDIAGNPGSGVALPAMHLDTQAPTTGGDSVAFSADRGASGTDLVTNVAVQTISGTLYANLVTGETVEVSLDKGLNWVAATASVGSKDWSLAGQTLVAGPGQQVQVRVSDAVGNHGAVFGQAYVLDQSAPTLEITSSRSMLNSAETALITFTFSEAPTGFDASSLSVSGGLLGGFTATANPLVYKGVFTPVAGQAAGVGTVSVAAGRYTDAAGNNGLAAAVAPISYATVAPGVAISSDISALRSGETAFITFEFSSAPQGFTFNDIVVAGGTLGGLTATSDPLIYTAWFTPNSGVAQGTAAINVASSTFTDTLGNAGVGGSMLPISLDTLAPTLSITSSASALNSGSTALITFIFSEAPLSFSLGNIGVTNGQVSDLQQTGNPAIYTAVLTPAANVDSGHAVISVAAGAYTDRAGNAGGVGTSPSINIDTLAPGLTSDSLRFLFDSGVRNFDLVTKQAFQDIAGTLAGGVLAAGDLVQISLDNGASWQSASAAVGGNSWVLSGQTLADGKGSIQVRVSDSNGNHGVVKSHAYELDTTAPSVSISSDSSSLRAGQSATISFAFSEAPNGFTIGDLIPSGGTLSGFTPTADPLVYTVVLTPTPGTTGSASVTLGSNVYTDIAGNGGSGGSSPSITVDTELPTLSITTSDDTLKAGATATITFTFSEAPTDFSLGDVSVSNGTLGELVASAGGLVYTALFTPTAGLASAQAVIHVGPGAYSDAVGNGGVGASSLPIDIDMLAPTTAVNAVAFSVDNGASQSDLITNFASQIITGTLTAPLAAGERVELSLDNGANWLTAIATAPASWALMPQQVQVGSGTLQLRVADRAGNTGPVLSQAYVVDVEPPTVVVTSSASTLRAGETATVTFTFSEVPFGFLESDLAALNGTLSGFSATVDPRVYTVLLTPSAGLNGGSASVLLAAERYTDIAGNLGGSASSPLITVDTAPPVLQITSNAQTLRHGEYATILFTFSEIPVHFALNDVSVSGGVLSGFGLTANPLVYTAIFTPTQGVVSGSATIGVGGGADTDAAGNAGAAAAMPPINYYTVPPSTAVTSVGFSDDTGISHTDLITSISLQTISGTLSERLMNGERVEVSLDSGATWVSASSTVGSAAWLLADQTLSGSEVLQVRVADAYDNHGTVWSSPYTIDTTPPSVTITSDVTVANGVTPAIITFTFSETPQGFSAADITVTGGQLGALTASADPRVFTATFTPTFGVAVGNATIIVDDGYTDLAGNRGIPGSIPSLEIDTVPPAAIVGGVQFSNDSGAVGDLVTNEPAQTISGTLSAPLSAGDMVQVSLDGGHTWAQATVDGATWSLAGQTLVGDSNGQGALVARVVDAAFNFSTAYSVGYTLDTQAPTVTISSNATGTLRPGQSATLTITLSDAAVLTPSQIVVSGGTLSNFSGSGTTYTATLTPTANSSAPLTVSVGGGVFTDLAGNASVAATPLVLSVNTIPATPQPEPEPQPEPTTVDGVAITITQGPGGSTIISIPVVTSNRPETPGTPSALADIPLFTSSSGHTLVLAGVPTGVGLQAEGLPRSTTGQTSLVELIGRIEQVAGDDAGLIAVAQAFHAGLASGTALTVQILKPIAGAGFDPDTPLVITGSSNAADGSQAVILDARSLPSGSTIQVDHVDFIAVVGAVRIIGGAGQNTAAGDGAAQYIVLGADDDIIHGGGGNDTVGSKGGDDQIYGDAGDDIVFGGAGNDLLSGGSGSDRLNGGTGFDVALQEGKRSDYTVSLDGAGVKLTHIASGVADWLVDVEQVRFETGPILTLAHSAAEEAAAFLFQQWMGRDLTQAEGAVIQTLDGLSALQVAQLFALVYPQQAGSKTPEQLLDGMEDAGAIRVNGERTTAFVGDAGDNTITPTLGLAWSIDGGAGMDTIVFPATLAQTHIEASANGFTLQRMTDGAMLELVNVERLTFSDTQLALDLDGHAGQAAKLLGALGGAAFLDNKPLVGEVIRALDAGISAQSLAQLGLQVLGAKTSLEVTQLIWTNVVGSAATPAQLQPFVDMMSQGVTGGELAVLASNLELNTTRIDLVGLAATGIEFA